MTGPIINGARYTWMEAACQLHQCLWCHNETKEGGEPFFIVRYFGRREGAVGSGGKSAQSAWRSAYETLANASHNPKDQSTHLTAKEG